MAPAAPHFVNGCLPRFLHWFSIIARYIMATFHFDLVSPEKLAFSGEVDQVDIPGLEGDFGVLAGHAPVVAAVRPGILTIITGGTKPVSYTHLTLPTIYSV